MKNQIIVKNYAQRLQFIDDNEKELSSTFADEEEVSALEILHKTFIDIDLQKFDDEVNKSIQCYVDVDYVLYKHNTQLVQQNGIAFILHTLWFRLKETSVSLESETTEQ